MHEGMRENETRFRIAILATGDEVVNGDIVNSNCHEIAARLTDAGINVRTHIAVPDTIKEIENALAFLLKTHDAIVMTGGLGPTSDDLTRYALSKILERPLQFNTTTWDAICQRLKRFGYPAPPESNRQQALFPEGATIISNPNGTAAGCMATIDNKIIFMLPGPPNECLPMFDHTVLPELKQAGFAQISFHKKWLLLGASEGKIGEELDTVAKPFDCMTGYRLFFPYLEFKLHSNNKKDFDNLIPLIEKSIKPYLVSNGEQTASLLLQKLIMETQLKLGINDGATGGALQAALETPMTRAYLTFSNVTPSGKALTINIRGLTEYWEQKTEITYTQLTMHISDGEHEKQADFDVPFRGGRRVIGYAVEFVCAQIYTFLKMENADTNLDQN
jgi:nicotinamide-nucleotide amidase